VTGGPQRARPDLVELILVRLPLRRPFTTSFGTETVKEAILVRASRDGAEGWGECVASAAPRYGSEWNGGAWIVLRDLLVPAALAGRPAGVKGHRMAAAALEAALIDLDLRARGESLASFLGGERDRVPVGVSLGLEERPEDLLDEAARFVAEGYRRIKLKIEPGRDAEVVRPVREAFPDVPLSVDANASYQPDDAAALAALDPFDLEYLEQPLAADRLLGHADLQAKLATPICLDETITSAAVAEEAIRLGACKIINVKLGRVGGPLEARRIHDMALGAGVPVWCGGMLETGIGRATNLALASLPGFTLPGDISGSERYFARDLTEPFVVAPDGTMAVPGGPGIGVSPIPELLDAAVVTRESVTAA